jgi:salicylate hydroxylase
MGERQTVVIAGAGIGGLTAALALSRGGYGVVIVERAAELSEAGAGIQVAPNAGRVLGWLGLDAAIAAKAIEPAAIEIRNGDSGRTVGSVRGAAFRERYGFPYRVIHRADLQAILVGAVRADPAIQLRLDSTIAERLDQDDGVLVRVRRSGGTDVVPAVAIVGADGVWSATRDTVVGSVGPSPSGRTAWRAIVPADIARDLVVMDRVGLWLGPEAHLVHYPVAGGAAVNIVAIVEEAWEKRGWSAVGDKADILRRFSGWAAPARELVAAPISWHKYAILTVDPRGAWTSGRIALLGDAAHAIVPFLAQGAAMAIEDAAVLADCLHAASDIATALGAYETRRKARVTRVAEASAEAGRHYQDRGIVASARDIALKFGGERLILGRNDWIYGWALPARDNLWAQRRTDLKPATKGGLKKGC